MAIETENDPVARLHESRGEIFALGRVLNGSAATDPGDGAAPGFPRSRLMRTLMGRHRGLLGGAAIALLVAKPQLALKVGRWAVMQPLLRRYLMPFLLRKL